MQDMEDIYGNARAGNCGVTGINGGVNIERYTYTQRLIAIERFACLIINHTLCFIALIDSVRLAIMYSKAMIVRCMRP